MELQERAIRLDKWINCILLNFSKLTDSCQEYLLLNFFQLSASDTVHQSIIQMIKENKIFRSNINPESAGSTVSQAAVEDVSISLEQTTSPIPIEVDNASRSYSNAMEMFKNRAVLGT